MLLTLNSPLSIPAKTLTHALVTRIIIEIDPNDTDKTNVATTIVYGILGEDKVFTQDPSQPIENKMTSGVALDTAPILDAIRVRVVKLAKLAEEKAKQEAETPKTPSEREAYMSAP